MVHDLMLGDNGRDFEHAAAPHLEHGSQRKQAAAAEPALPGRWGPLGPPPWGGEPGHKGLRAQALVAGEPAKLCAAVNSAAGASGEQLT